MSTNIAQTTAIANSILHNHSGINSAKPSSSQPSYNFSFTPFLRENAITALTSTVQVCPDFTSTGHCPRGRRCHLRHPTPSQQPQSSHHHYSSRGNDNFVCKHWLKGLCKKGDACDYLHEYNLRKMSECQFFNQNGYCQNGDECLYVHVKEDSKLPLCEDYNAGFCKMGPRCGKRHVRKRICEYYMAGFCPDGRECKFGVHLKSGGIEAPAKEAENLDDKRRRDRVEEPEKREDDNNRKEFGWKGGRSGRGGRWKNRRERKGN